MSQAKAECCPLINVTANLKGSEGWLQMVKNIKGTVSERSEGKKRKLRTVGRMNMDTFTMWK